MKTMQQIVRELDDLVIDDSKHPDRLYKKYRDHDKKREDATTEASPVYKLAQDVVDRTERSCYSTIATNKGNVFTSLH